MRIRPNSDNKYKIAQYQSMERWDPVLKPAKYMRRIQAPPL